MYRTDERREVQGAGRIVIAAARAAQERRQNTFHLLDESSTVSDDGSEVSAKRTSPPPSLWHCIRAQGSLAPRVTPHCPISSQSPVNPACDLSQLFHTALAPVSDVDSCKVARVKLLTIPLNKCGEE